MTALGMIRASLEYTPIAPFGPGEIPTRSKDFKWGVTESNRRPAD